MTRLFIFSLLLTIFSCSKDDEVEKSTNGFTISGKFYATPFATYANSGSTKDFEFTFMDKEIAKNSNGEYEFVGLENNKLNAFSVADLTLETENQFVGNFFYDETESLPFGIDGFSYSAEQLFDSNREAVNPPAIYSVTNGTVKIKSKSGQTFDIEYEATFDNGVSLKGEYKGQLQFREN